MKKNNYFLLYSNCILIKGYANNLIYDLQLGKYNSIHPALFPIIVQAKERKIKDLLELYEEKYHKIILENFEYLVKEGLGFYTNVPTQFPDLELYWDHPAIVTNVIIDLSNSSHLSLNKMKDFIEKIGCDAIQIVISSDFKEVEQILKIFRKARLKSIELLTNYISKENSKKLFSLCEKHVRVSLICFYKSPIYKKAKGKYNLSIIYSDSSVEASEFFKVATERWPFVINIPFFTESQKHHTYFNRKIYISATGDLKNAPECEEIAGNINGNNTEELIEAIETGSNQKYWYVSKDKCDICKNCEFRYMCMDNRIPYQRLNEEWYHKEECNYNPYIAKWKGEEGYKNLSECGIVSDENWFFIDYNKVEKINKDLELK